jgi:ABC-type transport system involved in cytochrome c biogenesis permease component
MSSGKRYTFLCNRWLADNQEDGAMERDLKPMHDTNRKNIFFKVFRDLIWLLVPNIIKYSVMHLALYLHFTHILYMNIFLCAKADQINLFSASCYLLDIYCIR